MYITPKKRSVKDVHKTTDMYYTTFSGVVSLESVWIALTYDALNVIDSMDDDIKNEYLPYSSSKKH